MYVTARSYLTAGVAALGAGAIALTPVQPIPNHLAITQERAVSNLAVTLASTIDPITPWVDTFKLAAQNLASLSDFYMEMPLPLLQTIGANIGTYFGELTSGNAALIPQQIANNVQTFFQAPWWNAPDSPIVNDNTFASDFISNTTVGAIKVKIPPLNLPLSQKGLFGLLPIVLTPEQVTQFGPILEFTATPYSGQAAGYISPFIGSVAELTRSFTAVGQFFQQGDLIGAINELINIPANMTNAFLNGYGNLDLTAIAAGLLPPEIKAIGLNLGGWISPPVPYDGSLVAPLVTPTEFTGGTLFDAVSVTAEATIAGLKGTAESPGLPTSAAGANIGLGQLLGQALLVTPPPPEAAVAPTAAVRAAAAEAAPEVPATVEATAPVIDIPAEVEAPAPQAVSAPAPEKQAAAASDNDGNSGPTRGGHKGARGKHAA